MSQVFMIVRVMRFRDGSIHQMVEVVLDSEAAANRFLQSVQRRMSMVLSAMLVVPGQGPVGKGQAVLAEVSVEGVDFHIVPVETGESAILAPPPPKLIVPS